MSISSKQEFAHSANDTFQTEVLVVKSIVDCQYKRSECEKCLN